MPIRGVPYYLAMKSLDNSRDLAEIRDRLRNLRERPHYMFGPLSESEWARWAYLHMDHHLRQFGL
jgi:hypothetical protein